MDQNRLSERQLKALPYFLASTSEAEACRQAKVSKQTFYGWLKEPAFKAELQRLRDLIVEDAVSMLKNHISKAVTTLVNLLDSDNSMLQRNVANDVIQHVARFKEQQEIERRLEALEARAEIIKKDGK